MYYFIERSLALVKPKQPLLDWINKTFTDLPQKLTLESIRIDCNTYLIPVTEELEEGVNFVDEQFKSIFELELASWTDEKKLWPKNLTLKMFWEWFDIEIHSTVIDTVTDLEESQKKVNHTTIH